MVNRKLDKKYSSRELFNKFGKVCTVIRSILKNNTDYLEKVEIIIIKSKKKKLQMMFKQISKLFPDSKIKTINFMNQSEYNSLFLGFRQPKIILNSIDKKKFLFEITLIYMDVIVFLKIVHFSVISKPCFSYFFELRERPILTFDPNFYTFPHLKILKYVLTRLFSRIYSKKDLTKKNNYIVSFFHVKGKIFIRTYVKPDCRIIEKTGFSFNNSKGLIELGPRIIAEIDKVFSVQNGKKSLIYSN